LRRISAKIKEIAQIRLDASDRMLGFVLPKILCHLAASPGASELLGITSGDDRRLGSFCQIFRVGSFCQLGLPNIRTCGPRNDDDI
jgi:hypothetical protein